MKKFLFSILALGATVLTGLSQGVPPSGAYAVNPLTIPVATLTAAAGTTNIAAGWSSVVSVTNTSTTWNSSSNAFITATNIISATNTVYADMDISMQKDLAIVVNESTGIGTNVYTFAPALNSTVVDTNNTFTITMNHTATGSSTGSVNLKRDQIGGFGKIRLISIAWTAASAGWTNNGINYAIKRTGN